MNNLISKYKITKPVNNYFVTIAVIFTALSAFYSVSAQNNLSQPQITFVRWCASNSNCNPKVQKVGEELTYSISFLNNGNADANSLIITDIIPDNTDFKIDSVTTDVQKTGLVFVIEYSSNFDLLKPKKAKWDYTPISGAGGASPGYDRLVKAIRWRVTSGVLSNISPNNTENFSFKTKIR